MLLLALLCWTSPISSPTSPNLVLRSFLTEIKREIAKGDVKCLLETCGLKSSSAFFSNNLFNWFWRIKSKNPQQCLWNPADLSCSSSEHLNLTAIVVLSPGKGWKIAPRLLGLKFKFIPSTYRSMMDASDGHHMTNRDALGATNIKDLSSLLIRNWCHFQFVISWNACSKPKQPPPAKKVSHKHWSKHPIWLYDQNSQSILRRAIKPQNSEDLKSDKHLCFRFIFQTKINVWSSPLPLQSSKHVAASGPHKMEAGRESSPVDLRWVLAGSFSYIWEMLKPHWKDATFIWLRHSKATRCETCKHFTWLAPLKLCVNQSLYSNYWKYSFFELHS